MRPRRILVVQTAFLGDLVLTTPLLDELRRRAPGATVHLVTTPAAAALVADDPRVDETIPFDKRQTPAVVPRLARLLRHVRGLRPELAIAAQRSWRSGLVARVSGAPRRVGFAGASGAWAYTDAVRRDPARHQAARYVELAAALPGEARPDVRPSLHVAPARLERAAHRLRAVGLDPGRPWLCLAPGSARATKRWPADRFAGLARLAASRGVPTCLIGAHEERELGETVRRAAGAAAPRSLVGRVPLVELPALVSLAAALVGNDSAPAHVAAAVGTPVVVVFGPTAPSAGYAPLGPAVRVASVDGLDCRPCSPRGPRRCPRGDLACLERLEPRDVLARALELLRPAPPLPARAQALVRPG